MVRFTLPDPRSALPLRRYWWNLKSAVWYISIIGIREFASRVFPHTRLGKLIPKRKRKTRSVSKNDEVLNVQSGEWVEVRSAKEIFATLDRHAKLRGLQFTREMQKYCGKRFKVYRDSKK